MTLTSHKIGSLISVVDERNTIGLRNFYGININKEFMPTVASTDGLDESKYKIVRKKRFVYSGMQTGRDKCIRISMYDEDEPIIVSPAYTTFEIKKTNIVDPYYFFMLFLSKEKDRLGWFCSDGSIRSNLDWNVFCDIELKLPPIEIQKKYVDIYKSMLDNQKCYERGLEDLKLTCEGYIEELRRNTKCEAIGQYIQESNNRNTNLAITRVQGVNSSSEFDETRANMSGVDISNYKIVNTRDFAYNPSRVNLGSIALLRDKECIVSPMYVVFSVINENELLPEYLMLWYERKEFQRSTLFYGMGSVRDTFSFDLMKEVEIPIPDIVTQKSISNIYAAYIERKKLRNLMTMQVKNICPILIKGALEEANK